MTVTITTSAPDPGGEPTLEHLRSLLKSLRLPDMADDLPGLLEESAREGWGQIDLLWELLRREDDRKSQRRFERNRRVSTLSEAYGLDHFDFELASEHGLESSLVRDLAQCDFVRSRRNLILAGKVGTGKTYLARTLGVEALKRGFKVYFFNTGSLLEELHRKRASFHFGKVYGKIRDVDVLILDDLAYLPYSPEKVEYLFSLVVDRYELKSGSTIVTSNTDVTEWWQFFPSKAMGMAFSDRLLEGAQGIRLSGESIRCPPPRRREPPPDAQRPLDPRPDPAP
jgi:DNA replication protein DnaC